MIYFTSDLHFCHNKPFLYEPRGFTNIEDMNAAIVKNWNNKVSDEDEVYVLGDLMLVDNVKGVELLQSLKGKIHVILGNHDTNTRIEIYKNLPNVVEVVYATTLKWNNYRFYLSHYPTITSNFHENQKKLKYRIINLYGHTHQKGNFYDLTISPCIYHVGVDSHNCAPVSIEEIIEEISQYICVAV